MVMIERIKFGAYHHELSIEALSGGNAVAYLERLTPLELGQYFLLSSLVHFSWHVTFVSLH